MATTLDQAFDWTDASERRNHLTNIYEPIQPYLLAEFSKHLGVSIFVDVGANIGFYSVIMASETDARTIYAYEPMGAAFSELEKNLALNGLSALSNLNKLALSSSVGETEMSVLGAMSGANSIRDTSIHKDKSSVKTERVPISTLDDELTFARQNVAIKIDVERHEAEVLKGGRRFLGENTCIIQFESLERESYHEECKEILTSLGYRKMITVGSDQYFSNMDFEASDVISCVSNALSRFVVNSKKTSVARKNQAIRWRLFRGVTLELSPGVSKRLRKLFGRTN